MQLVEHYEKSSGIFEIIRKLGEGIKVDLFSTKKELLNQ